ncbi:MAG: ABC-type transport auxiliary lipoprotein family protein [Dichotomicrobium sp.]
METRSRYILIGLFTATIIGAIFAFIYWLDNAAALSDRTIYRVRFEQPVSGLLVGTGVAFNGIRVGEVTELRLDAKRPKEVMALIAVDRDAPIRSDTRAEIDYQGVTGVATILLVGGSASAPPLTPRDGEPAVITADMRAGQNWTRSVGKVVTQLEDILDENAEPLNTAVTGLSKFSEALGRNADRIDSILAGLEKMTGSAATQEQPPVFQLSVPRNFPALEKTPSWQVLIPEPTVLLAMNTDKIIVAPAEGEIVTLPDARWSDNLPVLFQEKFIQSFENAGLMRSVVRPSDGVAADHTLLIDIRSFALSTTPRPVAHANFVAKLVDSDGRIVSVQEFRTSVDATSGEPRAAAEALSAAFQRAARELVVWTVEVI